MIESKTNLKTKLWIGIDVIMLILCYFLFLYLTQNPIVLFAVTVTILYRIKWRTDVIKINDTQIEINNWFTTSRSTINLNEIDGVVFNEEALIGNRLLLIKNNSVLVKIRYESYANMPELLIYLHTRIKERK
jgi:hypothetical protein